MAPTDGQGSYVVGAVGDEWYLFDTYRVIEILRARDVQRRAIPGVPRECRGMMVSRGRVLPVFDLRLVFGMPTIEDETSEIIEALSAREADHVAWLHELDACVRESRPFTLQRNPTLCKFGQWYKRVCASEESLTKFTRGHHGMRRAILAFEEPHTHIHALADRIDHFVREGDIEHALQTIDQTRTNVLRSMMTLFETTRDLARQVREPVYVIVESESGVLTFQVDEVWNVVHVDPASVEPYPGQDPTGAIDGVCKDVAGSGRIGMMLAIDRLAGRFFAHEANWSEQAA